MRSDYAAVAETHSGVVILLGDRALKMKKPVNLGFLDFTSLESRRQACEREVAMNRRLAPDVYDGVGAITGPHGNVQEYVVHMRRLPDERRLSTLVRQTGNMGDCIRNIAAVLATFHEQAEQSDQIDECAGRDALVARWEAELAGAEAYVGTVLDPLKSARVAELARAYLAGRRPLFEHRVASGRARDGHGDLLADDIFCLDDGPRILDCLDFDDRLRWDDVLADVAFLAMDLERLGRDDLADLLLNEHRRLSGDTWPWSLAHHHIAYRAHVRAKVACVRHSQGDPTAEDLARHHLDLAVRHLEAGRVRLVVVGGTPGSGKSTLGAGLAERLGAMLLRSDELRKEIAGVDVTSRGTADFETGLYNPAVTDSTYSEMLDRASSALERGVTVILDASWSSAAWRQRAVALAHESASECVMLRCEVPEGLAIERIRQRLARSTDASDATPDVARRMAERFEPWPEAVELNTERSVEASVEDAARAVEAARPPAG